MTEVVHRAVNPDGVVVLEPVADPSPGSTEDGHNVFHFRDGDPVTGPWTVSCRVTVRENGATAQDGAQADAVVDGSTDFPTANFQASGTPSGGTFDVAYGGLT